MRYGRSVEKGFLPVFSVDTEEQAKRLIVASCSLGPDKNYYASELMQEQTLENLEKFSDKLAKVWEFIKGSFEKPAVPKVKSSSKRVRVR